MRDRLLGKTLGDFHIESLLGSGAMGKVYRATQISLRRAVALKVLEEGVFTPDDLKVRFRREAEYIARLEHPHIISVYQYGYEEPYTYYAMRLVDGKSLEHHLADGVVLRTGLRWLSEIAGALAYAHGQQVIHRDVKPGNIMIANQVAYLADFGLARLLESTTITASGTLMGTLLYMSPEQVRRERAGEASDLYALGIILYELVTTRHPFLHGAEPEAKRGSGSGRVETMDRIRRGRFAAPSSLVPAIPRELEEIILRAMALEPKDRHGNARELQKDLMRAALLPDLARLDEERARSIGRPLSPTSTPGEVAEEAPGESAPPAIGPDIAATAPAAPDVPGRRAAPSPAEAGAKRPVRDPGEVALSEGVELREVRRSGIEASGAAGREAGTSAAAVDVPVEPGFVARMGASDAILPAPADAVGETGSAGSKPGASSPAAVSSWPPTALQSARASGERVGGYTLLEELGRTERTVVYKAVEDHANRLVALKVLRTDAGGDADRIVRFRLEAATAAALRHPNLVTIHRADEADGRWFCAMDLVEGEPLASLLRREKFSPRRVLEIIRDAARALACAHEQGVTHRDVRPGNLFLDPAGRVRVSDLGLTVLLRDERRSIPEGEEWRRSLPYLAPEQVRGEASILGPATDVYGLGATLYHLLVGRAPFDGTDSGRIGDRILTAAPLRPSRLEPGLNPDVEAICLQALEKRPADRYPSAREMAEDLDAFLSARAIAARRAISFAEAAVCLRARPWWTAGGAAVLLVGAALAWRGILPAGEPAAGPLRRAEALLGAEDADRAVAETMRAIEAAPDYGPGWFLLGRIELRRWLESETMPSTRFEEGRVVLSALPGGRNEARERSRVAFAKSLSLGGVSAEEGRIAAAAVALAEDRPAEAALGFVRGAHQHAPQRDLWLAAGRARYAAGEFGAALDAAQSGLERRPADPYLSEVEVRSLVALARVATSEGGDPRVRSRLALKICERQRWIDPGSPLWPALEEECRLAGQGR